MKRIAVLTTKTTAKYTDVDFVALKEKEMVFVHQWTNQGWLESFYIKSDTNGALLIFKDLEMSQVVKNMESLPFFPYLEKIEYIDLNKLF